MKIRPLILFLAISSLFSNCMISQSKAKKLYSKAEQKAPYDCVIVPGVPYEGTTWQMPMQIRLLWSTHLYNQGITNNIIYSGAAVYSPFYEAKIMELYGLALGIKQENIYLDTLAKHSTENVYYSYRVAKEQGFKKIALATDPFQAGSLRKFIKKHGLPVELIPIIFDTLTVLDHTEPPIRTEECIRADFTSIEENEGYLKRLNGTLGKQIVWYSSDVLKRRLLRKYRRQGRLIED